MVSVQRLAGNFGGSGRRHEHTNLSRPPRWHELETLYPRRKRQQLACFLDTRRFGSNDVIEHSFRGSDGFASALSPRWENEDERPESGHWGPGGCESGQSAGPGFTNEKSRQ